MLRRVAACTAVAATLSCAAGRARADEPTRPAAATAPGDDDLTTGTWRRPQPSPAGELLWQALALPEHLVALVFSPVAVLIDVTERTRLDRRVRRALRNDAGTVAVSPGLVGSGDQGFGAGAALRVATPAGGRVDGAALLRTNLDWAARARWVQPLAFAEGRRITLGAGAARDRNQHWYGGGNDTAEGDARALDDRAVDAALAFDMTVHDPQLSSQIEAGYRRESLAAGDDDDLASVSATGDTVAPPDDFGRTLAYGRFAARLRFDTRDSATRPTRGVLLEADGLMVKELSGATFGAFGGGLAVTAYAPLLPDHRVLVIRAGVRGVVPLEPRNRIPLHALTSLGRDQHLRGYPASRFRDDGGWWAGAEYRYPIYERARTSTAVDALWFLDLGRVVPGVNSLFDGPVRWSAGGGLRGTTGSSRFLELTLGGSREGVALALSVGASL